VNDQRYAHLATALLSRQPRPALTDSLGDRAATVSALEQALRGRARRRIWRNVGFSAAAAAALVVIWGWALYRPAHTVVRRDPPPRPPVVLTAIGDSGHGMGATLVRAQKAEVLRHRVPLRTGDRLRARHSADLLVSLSTGTRLDLAGFGELALIQLDQIQRFALPQGRLRAEVAKLDSGQRFFIQTQDSEIEVKGTIFEVTARDRACPDGSRTRVEVFEGTVTVRRDGKEVHVAAGSSWPPDCQAAAPAAPAPEPARPEPRPRRRIAVAPVEVPPPVETPSAPTPPPPPASTLAQQNDLFAEALEAHREGDTRRALRRLNELVTRFPNGPLTESAENERRKLRSERKR
jgi:ferric-dicitrate binding protein FerR (iron transport regulator)